MTVNEIIKTLECCNGYDCETCKALKCCDYMHPGTLARASLDLINRQKAEIEALQMDNKQLQSDVINANQNWDHIKVLWECEKEKVESAKQKVICACKMLTTAKSEEIKEFADRLKEGIQENHYYTSTEDMGNRKRYVHITNIKDFSQYIDNLVKEMTEVENGSD